MRAYVVTLVVLLLLCWPWATVFAHGVTLFAWVEGDRVRVESKFSGGRKPKAVPIEVYGPQGKMLLAGVTDDNGTFSFKVPQQTDLHLVLLAGAGHRAEWKISREELAHVEVTPALRSGPGKFPPSDTHPPETRPQVAGSNRGVVSEPISPADMESIVERAVEKQLGPIRRQLAENRSDSYSFKDILGGLGYIMGLVGLAAYMGRRKK